jgi:hypothetical protein
MSYNEKTGSVNTRLNRSRRARGLRGMYIAFATFSYGTRSGAGAVPTSLAETGTLDFARGRTTVSKRADAALSVSLPAHIVVACRLNPC